MYTDGYTATLCGKVIGPRGKVLKTTKTVWGYHLFYTRRGKARAHSVHRFVYEFFNGQIPEGLVVNHKDGDKTNNRVSNLEAVTQYENCLHGNGTKLTIEDVRKIRASNKKQKYLAQEFGVSASTISDIKRGKTHHD